MNTPEYKNTTFNSENLTAVNPGVFVRPPGKVTKPINPNAKVKPFEPPRQIPSPTFAVNPREDVIPRSEVGLRKESSGLFGLLLANEFEKIAGCHGKSKWYFIQKALEKKRRK